MCGKKGEDPCPPGSGGPVRYAGFSGNLIFGAGIVIGVGEWHDDHSRGTYVKVALGVGYDISAGGEVGASDSYDAFHGQGEAICGGATVFNGCMGGNSAGSTSSGGVAYGPSEIVASGHTETGWTFTPTEEPIPAAVVTPVAPDATAVSPQRPPQIELPPPPEMRAPRP